MYRKLGRLANSKGDGKTKIGALKMQAELAILLLKLAIETVEFARNMDAKNARMPLRRFLEDFIAKPDL